jgi:hypothetical protein
LERFAGAWLKQMHALLRCNLYRERENQPFDYPRSNPSTALRTSARGLLRVDTERRFLPRPKGWGLALSKYQVIELKDKTYLALWVQKYE